MRIVIVGAGPAGLYLSLLLRRSGLPVELTVLEQNAPDSTFGFGVVFSENALEFLKEDDPDIFGAVTPELEAWSDIAVVHRGTRVQIDGERRTGRCGRPVHRRQRRAGAGRQLCGGSVDR